jgi:hypothetical protein
VRAGSGSGQRGHRQRGQYERSGQPQEWQPPASNAFWLAERTPGGDNDDRRGRGLEHERELQRAIGVPVPDQRDPQPDAAERYRRHGRREAPAGGVQPDQSQSSSP